MENTWIKDILVYIIVNQNEINFSKDMNDLHRRSRNYTMYAYACIIVYMYIHAVAIEQNTTYTGTSP